MLQEWVFWGCLGALFCAYAGYPLALAALAALVPATPGSAGALTGKFSGAGAVADIGSPDRAVPGPASAALPTITLLVPARNEAHQIAEKVRDCLALDYPGDRLEILVLDDASTDGTGDCALAAATAEVSPGGPRLGVVRLEGGRGKAAALNAGARQATGELLVLSDADCRVAPDALRLLAAHFADPRVACAAGRYVLGHALTADAGGLYWRYEDFIRTRESALGGILGASGALYAVRRSRFTPLPAGLINDDFVVPMRLRLAGFRTVYDPRAVAVEVTGGAAAPSPAEEMARRIRIMAGNCQHLALFCRLLPRARRRLGPAVQMFCHKFLRVAGPAFLVGLAASNLALVASKSEAAVGGWVSAALAAQAIFYALAWAGPGLAARIPGRGARFLTCPRYFVMLNAAAAAGAYRFLFRAGRGAWGARDRGAATARE